MMRVYLAGPMAGVDGGNFPEFREAAEALREMGHEVVSPVELNEADGMSTAADPGHPRRGEFLARDVALLCDPTVDAVVLLPGWEKSAGCLLEAGVAEAIGKPRMLWPIMDPLPERHPASDRFHAILRGAAALHDLKSADYGTGDDPFANVRASEDWGIPAWIGTMVRGTDKVKRLQTFARTGHLQNEGVLDAFDDLAVYAVIARVLYEETQT
jgi:nucleoside 2-deoxyribosyltransferase